MIVELVIAGVVSLGVIAVVRAIVKGLSIARRPPHHPSKSISQNPSEAQGAPRLNEFL